MHLAPGVVLAGRYRLERKLGAGGMGEVWAAKNATVGTDVAVKVMLPAAAVNAEIVMRFRREAFLLARVRNDHVSRVLDFASDDTYGLVLVMDLVAGESLSEVLHHRRLSVEEAIDVGIDVLRGIADLHRANIVHRDLKPGNVMLERRVDASPRAVIVDFGLGRLMSAEGEDHDTSGITRADMAVGTVEYMSPEQILNSRRVTGAADIYSLGAMLYRAVAGQHMFGDLSGVQLAQTKLIQLPPPLVTGRQDALAKGFEAAIAKAIARRPEDRYARAEDMLFELKRVLTKSRPMEIEDEPTTVEDPKSPFVAPPASFNAPPPSFNAPPPSFNAPPPSFNAPPPVPVARKSSAVGTVIAVIAALIVGVGVGAFLGQRHARLHPLPAPQSSP